MTEGEKHVEETGGGPPTVQNAFGAPPFAMSISFPETVSIKMVDASALNDYEIMLAVAFSFSSAFVGFLIGAIQAKGTDRELIIITVMMLIAAIVFFIWALAKRKKITARSKEFVIKTSGIEQVK
jgi:hypothetical protein